jgi:sugar phosphate permease
LSIDNIEKALKGYSLFGILSLGDFHYIYGMGNHVYGLRRDEQIFNVFDTRKLLGLPLAIVYLVVKELLPLMVLFHFVNGRFRVFIRQGAGLALVPWCARSAVGLFYGSCLKIRCVF